MKKIICLLCVVLLLPISVTGEELQLNSRGAVLIDAETNRVLYGKNECDEMAMASTTKIMTCIIALEYGDLDEVTVVSENAVNKPKVRLGVKKDEQYVLEDLLYAMMLESFNDVSVVVAEAVAGSVKKFATYMNKKAKEIGAVNTNFVTPNGLDAQGHYSTAKDMAIIGAYAIKNEKFREIIKTRQHNFYELTANKPITVNNKDSYLSINKNAIGIKTGFTNDAGYCFVGACEYEEMTLVSCVLGCGWPPNSKYKWNDTTKLMDYGKDNYKNECIYKSSEIITFQLEEGEKNSVIGKINNDLEALLNDNDEVNIVTTENITLPIRKGDKIGELEIWINEDIVFKENIYSLENIEKNKIIAFFKKIISWFKGE